MDYFARYQQLARDLSSGVEKDLDNSDIRMMYFPFQSTAQTDDENRTLSMFTSDIVPENQEFCYPVFFNKRKLKQNEVIVLFHGLNERNWNKYYPWAEYLCQHTGKAVVMFPIAYHVNRSPQAWSNPRVLTQLLEQRKQRTGNDRSLSFANLALSERLTARPLRFFTSGRQSYMDVVKLCTGIKEGRHPLFEAATQVDVFAYSIGAFLAQILFMTDPLFAGSRLFMFCGGGIFSSMYGCSRSIMDAASYDRLYQFYLKDFNLEDAEKAAGKELGRSFHSMIAPFHLKEMRLQIFRKMKDRMQGISLKNDKVMPFSGVQEALGEDLAAQNYTLLDLPYDYTHENPFPLDHSKKGEINESFLKIFKSASEFFAS